MIFLDLTKAYDALDRSSSLEILKGYGVGEIVRRLLREYWNKSMMVARAGGYYEIGFKGGRGVTQGDPLSSTIFNLVADAVVRHWVMLTVTEAETRGEREREREGRHQAALFYSDDGMIASSDPQCLQWAFTQLVGLFDRVGLNTNTIKTVSMTCRPCTAAGNRLEEAYGRLMTGEGLTFRERKRERVECGDCGKEVAAGSLDSHRMSQHGKAMERRWTWTEAATGGEKGENLRHIG